MLVLMRFGIMWNTAATAADPDAMVSAARVAEECGFESFWLPEHVALYPGAGVEGMSFAADLAIADPLECLSFVAASTSRLLLGTGVMLLPFHHPVVLAKRLATLDVLSRGRMRLFGIGVGSLPGEAEAVGVDFATRGRRADEAIDVMRALWSSGAEGTSFDGEFYRFGAATSFPKPAGTPTLPIHVGGSSLAAARRAGQRGDGFFPGGVLPPEERRRQLEHMRTCAVEAGRDPDRIEITRWSHADLTVEGAESMAEQGADRLILSLTGADDDERRRQLEEFASRHNLG
jgi:probable F420-dependent oxidoreductase